MFLASEKRQFQILQGSAPDPAGGLTAPPGPQLDLVNPLKIFLRTPMKKSRPF